MYPRTAFPEIITDQPEVLCPRNPGRFPVKPPGNRSSALARLIAATIVPVAIAAEEPPAGYLHIWTNDYQRFEQNPSPEELGPVIDYVMGRWHQGALYADGTTAVWDHRPVEVIPPEPDAPQIVSLEASRYASYALRSDATLTEWPHENASLFPIPSELPTVTQLAVGLFDTIGIKPDLSVVHWRGNELEIRVSPPSLSQVQAVSAGEAHFVALLEDGTVVAWGFPRDDDRARLPAELENVIGIAAGGGHSVVVTSDGTLHAFGLPELIESIPTGEPGNYIDVTAGRTHTVGLTQDGQVHVWNAPPRLTPTIPPGVKAVAIFAGEFHTAVLTDHPFPVIEQPLQPITVSPGHSATFAIKTTPSNGIQYQWHKDGIPIDGATDPVLRLSGVNSGDAGTYRVTAQADGGIIASTSGDLTVTPDEAAPPEVGRLRSWRSGFTPLPEGSHEGFVKIAAGSRHSLFLRPNGTLTAVGANNHGQTEFPENLPPIKDIAAGHFHSLAATESGDVIAWGDNRGGQTDVPSGLTGVRAVTAGARHSVALLADGTVVAWGSNDQGQLNVPTDLNDVVQITTGDHHTLARLRDGSVVAWGQNRRGQADVPADLDNVIDVAAGTNHSYALRSDGRIIAWGSRTTPGLFPNEVLSGVIDISANGDQVAYVLANGEPRIYPEFSHLPLGATGRVLSITVSFETNVLFIESPIPNNGLHLALRQGNPDDSRLELNVHTDGRPLSASEIDRLVVEHRANLQPATEWQAVPLEPGPNPSMFQLEPQDSTGYFRARLELNPIK